MKVGFGKSKITPTGGKIAIAGTLEIRYTDVVKSDVWATCMIMESNEIKTIWVTLDMCHPTRTLFLDVYYTLKNKIPELKEEQLIISTTHSTAYYYVTDDEFCDVGTKVECDNFLPLEDARKQICSGILNAYLIASKRMQNANLKMSVSDVTVGFCRRILYKNNKAVMYGNPYDDDFLRMEYPDGGEMIFLYFTSLETGRLIGIFSAVPCPAQADEENLHITADFWDTVRNRINAEFGEDVCILTCCRAAGELSPHKMLHISRKYRVSEWGSDVAERVGNQVADEIIRQITNPLVSFDLTDITHKNIACNINFPIAEPTSEQYELAKEYFDNPLNFKEKGEATDLFKYNLFAYITKVKNIKVKEYLASSNVVKIGELVFFTAPCELFSEYAKKICSAFKDYSLIDVQLTNDCFGYLPTKEAIEHGGYSTEIFSTVTDKKGGEIFVEKIIDTINKVL